MDDLSESSTLVHERRARSPLAVASLAVASVLLFSGCQEDDGDAATKGDSDAHGATICRGSSKSKSKDESAGLFVRGGADDAQGKYGFMGMLLTTEPPGAGSAAKPTQPAQSTGILGGTPLVPGLLNRINPLGPNGIFGGGTGAAASGSQLLCSGVLACPNVVLTAAHCFDGDIAPERFIFVPETVPDENSVATAARGVSVQVASPGGAEGRLDMALLKLDRDMVVDPAPFIGKELPANAGKSVTEAWIVGYGANVTANGKDEGSGTRRVGRMTYGGISTGKSGEGGEVDAVTASMAVLRPHPEETAKGSGSNACVGDSGGAAVVDGRVLGVVAKIMNVKDGVGQDTAACSEANVTLVATVAKARDWLDPALKAACSDGGASFLASADSSTPVGGDEGTADEDCD